MGSTNHEPRLSTKQGSQEGGDADDGENELASTTTSNNYQQQSQDLQQSDSLVHNIRDAIAAEPSRRDFMSSPSTNSSPSTIDNDIQDATTTDAMNSAISNDVIIGSDGNGGMNELSPISLTGTTSVSIELLPPVYATANQQHSAGVAASTYRSLDVHDSGNDMQVPELDHSMNLEDAHVTHASLDAPSGPRGDVALAVAEIVAQRSTSSFGEFGDGVEDQIEDRAYQIARRVLNEIRQNAVDADEMVTVVAGGTTSATIITETQEQRSQPVLETQTNDKDLPPASVLRRRILVLLGLVALLMIVVIVLVVLLVTRYDTANSKSSLASSVQTSAPTAKCSFCAGGTSTPYSFAELRKIPVGSNPIFPTCGDIYTYQQSISSTDTSCPVLQALAFYYYCGCQTVPAKPKNATCTACPNGVVATGSLYCAKVDTVVSVVGSSLFYFENCNQLAYTELQKYGCKCPVANSTSP